MDEKKREIKIAENTVVGSQYCQLVNVSVTDFDVTLQFAFVNPRTGKDGHIVSRVTIPQPIAENLAQTIQNTINLHNKAKEGKQND